MADLIQISSALEQLRLRRIGCMIAKKHLADEKYIARIQKIEQKLDGPNRGNGTEGGLRLQIEGLYVALLEELEKKGDTDGAAQIAAQISPELTPTHLSSDEVSFFMGEEDVKQKTIEAINDELCETKEEITIIINEAKNAGNSTIAQLTDEQLREARKACLLSHYLFSRCANCAEYKDDHLMEITGKSTLRKELEDVFTNPTGKTITVILTEAEQRKKAELSLLAVHYKLAECEPAQGGYYTLSDEKVRAQKEECWDLVMANKSVDVATLGIKLFGDNKSMPKGFLVNPSYVNRPSNSVSFLQLHASGPAPAQGTCCHAPALSNQTQAMLESNWANDNMYNMLTFMFFLLAMFMVSKVWRKMNKSHGKGRKNGENVGTPLASFNQL